MRCSFHPLEVQGIKGERTPPFFPFSILHFSFKPVAARYAVMLRDWNGQVSDGFRRQLRALRNLCHGVVRLRGREQAAARLEFARDPLDWQLDLAASQTEG